MEIEAIRECIRRGAFAVTDHAMLEGFKEGITEADMVRTIERGRVIEQYPERRRCLVFARRADGLPIHVVVEYPTRSVVDLVTAYIPQRQRWIRDQVRKRRKR